MTTTSVHPGVVLSALLVLAGQPLPAGMYRLAALDVGVGPTGWGDAVRHLRARGHLVESVDASGVTLWAAGPALRLDTWGTLDDALVAQCRAALTPRPGGA